MALVSFGSDNHSGVHPRIFEAMAQANTPYAPSYGMDDLSLELQKRLRKEWGCHDVHLVFNGTAANVLCLAATLESFHSVLCTDISHLNVDECSAPENHVGVKLVTVPHRGGKLRLEDLPAHLVRRGDQHSSQIKMVSITQPTEYGTLYSLEELRALRAFCDQENLLLHIDGARLGNACFRLGCDFKDIISCAHVVSLGGTKNGLLFGELVILNTAEAAENFKFRRKQAMQLPSKTRFMAAQFTAYFAGKTWREIAEQQCEMARYLGEGLTRLGYAPNFPVESNAVFCNLPRHLVKPLRDEYFFYVWNEATFECRLMTSLSTRKEEIDLFLMKLETLRVTARPH